MSTIPITVISGFAGTGKTSVLLDLLGKRKPEEQSAVIMNDIAEVVTGTDKVRKAMGDINELLLELPNGCICCTQKDVFSQAVEKIAESTVDHLYIEGNATAEPSLIRSCVEESSMADQVYIQEMITVIDASTFLQDFLSTDELRDRGLVALSYDDRTVSEVLTEQIECADTLVITKSDLVSDADVVALEATLSALNPTAKVTIVGKRQEYNSKNSVDQFTFTAQKPFHPLRLHAALQTDAFNSVLRAKGTAWIASRQHYRVWWSQTGSVCSLESDGPWSADSGAQDAPFQAIEFIGTDLNTKDLTHVLEDCLLTEVEMQLGPDLWMHFDDPFEEWEHHMDRSLFIVREPFVLR